jgi:glucose-1-phosphate thymidylyltransferase
MAGRGSRLRPHTLTIPKPMVPVAGKPIVQRLVEDLSSSQDKPFENIAFVLGDFGEDVEKKLLQVAQDLGSVGHIFYQEEPLGTAHAIDCARDYLEGSVIIAFGDTLFEANMEIDAETEGIIWAKRVEDPSAYGVLELDDDGYISGFVEKPEEFVSDLAITGIYYIKEGEKLRDEIQYLLDNDIKEKGEYQLTNALENMKEKGTRFQAGIINEWLDLGNKHNFVYSNQRILELKKDTEKLVSSTAKIENSIVIPPCFIGNNARIVNSVIGPHVSVGDNSRVHNSILKNAVIQNNSEIVRALLKDSMIGNQVSYTGNMKNLSIGDFSEVTDK